MSVVSGKVRRAIAIVSLMSTVAWADDAAWDISANVDVEGKYFVHDARWSGQDSATGRLAIAASAEFRWRNSDGDQRASIIPYLRWDQADEERSLADLREAYWATQGDSYEFLVGVNTVFWGVAESVHLVDIINQTDVAADIDGETKLGQPMINLALQRDWGLINLYALPYFRERNYSGPDGRFRSALPARNGGAIYESDAEDRHIDFALRYSHYFGNVDIGVSVFSGTSREPRLLPDPAGEFLVAHYDLIDQAGVDLQYTGDAWLWKLEAIARNGGTDTFAAFVGGFEYTRYQVGGSAADLGMLLEYQYDGRDAGEPATIADNDIFAGMRLAMNDVQDTSVLAGLGYDVDSGDTFVSIKAERRIGDDYVLELRLRAFDGEEINDPLYSIRKDDYIEVKLSRYF